MMFAALSSAYIIFIERERRKTRFDAADVFREYGNHLTEQSVD